MMNENKSVAGMNVLHWWDREGLDRLIAPLAQGLADGRFDPVVAEAFPSTGRATRTATSPRAGISARSSWCPEPCTGTSPSSCSSFRSS